MTALLDTSVILASLDPDEPAHESCDALLAQGGHQIYVHALAESFSILTGGRKARRLDAAVAAQLLQESILPFIKAVTLTGKTQAGIGTETTSSPSIPAKSSGLHV